jgi:hypothetical protein
MGKINMPFVAIVGGFFEWGKSRPDDFEKAKAFARTIGGELAKANTGLVVYYSHNESLEPYVVSGYVKATPRGEGAGSIKVRFAQSQRGEVKFVEQDTRNELFDFKLFAGDEWEAPFYRSLVEIDGDVQGVLLMAGGRSSLIAGQIAVARSLPVLAIDNFGGAAGIIWTELALGATDNYPSSSTQNHTQLVEWFKNEIVVWSERRELIRKSENNYLNIISQGRKSLWAGVTFIVLLTIIFFGMIQVPAIKFYPFLTFIGLIASGATGAIIRSVITRNEQSAISTSLLLGGVAGFIVGIAYLIPQWVGAPGVLEASSTGIAATDKIQFISAVLVAISGGVGFDTVFSKLKKQSENQSISPPGQS